MMEEELMRLSQLYHIRREIMCDQQRLKSLEDLSAAPAGSRLTGMPRGPGGGRGVTERYATEIADLRAHIEDKVGCYFRERDKLERYIAGIADSETRWVLTLRFVDCLPWAQVAANLGEDHTADQVKKVCYRYLRRHTAQGAAE